MSILHPRRTTRRILQIASLGLAGLLAGLLSGCSSNSARAVLSHNDTDWQTPGTYASATSALSPRAAVRSAHIHFCSGVPCGTPGMLARPHHSRGTL